MSDIKITAEPQNDSALCKFMVEASLTSGPTLSFEHLEKAKGSALAETLFKSGNVSHLRIAQKTITVRQSASEDWRVMGKRIGQAIRTALASQLPLIDPELYKTLPPTDVLRAKVEKILIEQVNPQVASHGGFIELTDIVGNDIYIKMGGGCQGCASSQATLRQGVEHLLRRDIPELGMIHDATDHAAGQNPYQ